MLEQRRDEAFYGFIPVFVPNYDRID